jgi:hypothetical protein
MRIVIGLFGFAAVFVLWNVGCVFVLRAIGISIPFAFIFHLYQQRERDLVMSLQGRSKHNHIFVSGFIWFTCPSFLGLIAYDRLTRVGTSPAYYVGSAVLLVIMTIAGISVGNRTWKKSLSAP